jgi:hypothetical protein
MATFKHSKLGPSGSTGGISTNALPTARHKQPSPGKRIPATGGGKGKPAVGTFANQVAKVASNQSARGQSRVGGGKAAGGKPYSPGDTRGKVANPPGFSQQVSKRGNRGGSY